MLTKAHYTVIYAGLDSDGFFSTDTAPPQINRMYGRKFRGVGADHGAQPDGSVTGEGVGSGTGVLVFYDGSNWIAVDSGATVVA